MLFLDSVLEKQREEERLRKEMDGKELKSFRECVCCHSSRYNADRSQGRRGTGDRGE